SIGIEWLFYFSFPLTMAILRSVRTAAIAWLLLCPIAILGKSYYSQNFGGQLNEFGALYLLSHAHYFALGFLILHLKRAGLPLAKTRIQRQACGSAFLAILAAT
ncbi:hypothetical protein, partial [Pseudomonas viridiflava]|uniref:hypothetical protein n=1 Tax=Pseudomonas viridiflava TaxID=33069 RepID=UPI001CA9ACB3